MFETKDSGKRQQFGSGMQRDTQDNKTLYHLVYDGPLFKRWAELLTRGAKKYSEGNWLKATGPDELKRFKASAARHFFQWYMDEADEDHAAAVTFNINGAEYVKGKMRVEIENRITPVDLMEKGETFTDDDIVDALYAVQEGAGTPSPHAAETAERFNGGRPYYDETYTEPVLEVPKPGEYVSRFTSGTYTLLPDDTVLHCDGLSSRPLHIPSSTFLYAYENGHFDEQPGQYIAVMQQRRVEAAQALADHLRTALFADPDFTTSCSVSKEPSLLDNVVNFLKAIKFAVARKLYEAAVSLDPELAYGDVEE